MSKKTVGVVIGIVVIIVVLVLGGGYMYRRRVAQEAEYQELVQEEIPVEASPSEVGLKPVAKVPVASPVPSPVPKPAPVVPVQQPGLDEGYKLMWVNEHNRVRGALNVGLPQISWNNDIAKGALAHSKKCVFQHSLPSERQYGKETLGENLGWGSPYQSVSDKMLFGGWESEKKDYKHPSKPIVTGSNVTGHYTQIVNKNVTQVGCACAKCDGDDSKLCTCRYLPGQTNEPPY